MYHAKTPIAQTLSSQCHISPKESIYLSFFNVACLALQTSPQPLSDTVPNACDHSLDDIYGPSNSTYPGLNYMAILWILSNIVGLLLQPNPNHFFTTWRRRRPPGKGLTVILNGQVTSYVCTCCQYEHVKSIQCFEKYMYVVPK